jgi:hypothetical protein
MLRRVKIKVVPKARTGYQVRGALANDVPAFGGADYNAYIGQPDTKVNKTISAVPRKEANLEAEGGETVVGNLDGSNIPSFKKIVGPRHYNGGVPLNLPDDSFIFSDTKSMKISDPHILKMFNKTAKKGGYTPAELSKKFDINKYRQILQDPNSDKIDIKTAELMIKTCVLKLGALALAQESKKSFPQGIPKIAEPYMEANGIAEEDLIPKKHNEQEEMPQQEMSESSEMQGMEGQQEIPMQMPNGEPVAMPQQGMQQMQQAPMAAYGMEMGGYDMPYSNDPYEMAYGGSLYRAQDGITVNGIPAQQRNMSPAEGSGYQKGTVVGAGPNAQGYYRSIPGAERTYVGGRAIPGGSRPSSGWAGSMCDRLMQGATIAQLVSEGHGTTAGLTALLKDCIPKAEEKFKEKQDAFYNEEGTPEITTTTATSKSPCECTDPDTGETYDPGEDANGNCNDCTKDYPGSGVYKNNTERNPEWWLQDTVNTFGAVGDLAGIRKYMPFEVRADFEEPRPTFVDDTRGQGKINAAANVASQVTGQFARAQGQGANLSAIQGANAAAAADLASQTNNQNVNIGNQFEATQVGVRNQENLLNQQMANRVYDKNVVANQQFDNAKRQGRANVRESYNTALTNRAKTDAMNQMYPNYQVGPRSGGLVNYTPTDKKVSPGAKEMSPEEYAQSISKYDPKVQAKLMELKFGKYGGQFFEHGGYVYSTFPII